jgi:hypothetical protein
MKSKNYEDRQCGNPSVLILLLSFKSKYYPHHLLEHLRRDFVVKSFFAVKGKYSGRKITVSLGNVTVRGEKRWKGQGGSTTAKSLSERV